MHYVGPCGGLMVEEVLDFAHAAFAVVVVVGDVEGSGAGGVDVVWCAD